MKSIKLGRSDYTVTDGSANLLPELISGILSRLPSKILCKFKCVSKDFLSLISSNSQFKDLHRVRFSKNPRLIQYDLSIIADCFNSEYKLSQSTFDLTSGQVCDQFELSVSKSSYKHDSFIQVTSCRELVCIYTDRQILVLNPSTHQFISLAVDSKILPNSVGIGYVDSCKEYKVVRINRSRSTSGRSCLAYHDLGCHVYTVKDDTFNYSVRTKKFEGKKQTNLYEYDPFLAEQLPICVDGVLYWLTIISFDDNKMVLNYLNLKDSSYGKFPFQEEGTVDVDENRGTLVKLVELQGYLCIQCTSLESNGFRVYALKDTKLGLWEEVYNILYPPDIDVCKMFLVSGVRSDDEFEEFKSYMPPMSHAVPQVLGFLPSSNGSGVPEFVVSEDIDDETCRVHIVDQGAIKTSTDIRFSLYKTRRLLCYEGLFSFKNS